MDSKQMNTNDMIEITGCDLKEVAKAVYDLSHPVGMGNPPLQRASLNG